MPSPFTRTMRSLQTDNFRFSIIGLILAIALSLIWIIWFFYAKITIYEISQKANLTAESKIVSRFSKKAWTTYQNVQRKMERVVEAYFLQESLGNLEKGQKALIDLDGEIGRKIGVIPASVTLISNEPGDDFVKLRLKALFDYKFKNDIEEGLTGQVRVEVEKVTPATMIMRSSGLFGESVNSITPDQVVK